MFVIAFFILFTILALQDLVYREVEKFLLIAFAFLPFFFLPFSNLVMGVFFFIFSFVLLDEIPIADRVGFSVGIGLNWIVFLFVVAVGGVYHILIKQKLPFFTLFFFSYLGLLLVF